MLYLSLVVLALSPLLAGVMPRLYLSVREKVITENRALEAEQRTVSAGPLAALCCLFPCLFVYGLTDNGMLSLMVFLFGLLAFSDLATRWLPDCLIYSVMAISVYAQAEHLLWQQAISAGLFCLPLLALQMVSLLRGGAGCFASGDFYLFPAIALWIKPEYTALVSCFSLLVAVAVARVSRQKAIPFITCTFPVFLVYLLCDHLLPL